MKHFIEKKKESERPFKRQRKEAAELPPEMWVAILDFLTPSLEDCYHLSLVNKLFHDLMKKPLERHQSCALKTEIDQLQEELRFEVVPIVTEDNHTAPWHDYTTNCLFYLFGGQEIHIPHDPANPIFPAHGLQIRELWGKRLSHKWLNQEGQELKFENLASVTQQDLKKESTTRSGTIFKN